MLNSMKKSKEYRILESLDLMVRTGILKRRKNVYRLTNRFKNNQLNISRKIGNREFKDAVLLASLTKHFEKAEEDILTTAGVILK